MSYVRLSVGREAPPLPYCIWSHGKRLVRHSLIHYTCCNTPALSGSCWAVFARVVGIVGLTICFNSKHSLDVSFSEL
jgi:hypothetical protein